ncbi:hypothetical protein Tsubulata_032886, partial [Turnera subulata]
QSRHCWTGESSGGSGHAWEQRGKFEPQCWICCRRRNLKEMNLEHWPSRWQTRLLRVPTLMESLSIRSIRHLKETVLPSDGIQNLISQDMDELLRIVASDKEGRVESIFE